MNVSGLRELDEMAAKLEATIHKLSQSKRGELLEGIERIRAQLAALLAASEDVSDRIVESGLKAKGKG